jgi:hypothetical protein
VTGLTSATDTGSSHTDGITSDTTPTITGTGTSGDVVTVKDGATVLGTATVTAGAWSLDLTGHPLSSGTHSITAFQTEVAGNQGAASAAFTVDIETSIAAPSTPVLLPATDSGVKGDGITDINLPIFTGTAEANATVYVYANGALQGSTTANGSGVWMFDQPTALSDSTYAITATAMDLAGNTSVASGSFSLTIDTATPVAPSAPALLPATDSGVKGDGITDVNKPIFMGTAPANDTVYLYANGGLLGSTTANSSGAWTFVQPTPIGDGTFSITATAKDAAGKVSAASSAFSLTIDTTPPAAPSTPALLGPTDSGVKGDGITDVNLPIFTGTAEANATVYVYANGGLLGSTTASGAGAWTFVQPTPSGDGTFSITAIAKDAAGNLSVASSAFSLTIDTATPAAPSTPALLGATDSGVKGDGITDINLPIFTGTAPANDTVFVYANGGLLGSTTANGSGAWTYVQPTPIGDGTFSITAAAQDVAGKTSVASSVFSLTIDTATPPAPSTPALAAASDSGVKGDGITDITTPVFIGTAQANDTVFVYANGLLLGTTTANSSGDWTFVETVPFNDTTYAITASAEDVAGKVSVASSAFSLTIT